MEALYRKYRPSTFADVVGQEHIERTLKNAIEQDKVSHAYLFCGPRGTGKTTTARILAKALMCEKGPTIEPDGTCEECQAIAQGTHPDVYELDAASRTGVGNHQPCKLRANSRYLEGLHHRRGAYALDGGLQCASQNHRRTAKPCRLHSLYHRSAEGSRNHSLAMPAF